MTSNRDMIIGLIDADLLFKGTRHPNLVILKLAGYFRDHKISCELVIDDDADLEKYSYVYLSKVFTKTELPKCVTDFQSKHLDTWDQQLKMGGTGFYATVEDLSRFGKKRKEDMSSLNNDPLLPDFSMAHQMPDYDIYRPFVDREIYAKVEDDINAFKKKNNDNAPTIEQIEAMRKKTRLRYKDYLDYSIGFLTRGCIRQCSFCVNKGERGILPYSQLKDFVDDSRPYIYLWDDNFLCYKNWKELLQELIDKGKPFQFRQGLDERVLDEERAEMLSKSPYHGDFIFAFDQWKDRDLIERKLKIWKYHCSNRTTKFYLFCGYELTKYDDEKLYNDVYYLFKRIEILMSYGCLGYVMRHADYTKHPLGNIYVQIARWCNQPSFYKKMSFWEFVYRNQTYWEQHNGFHVDRELKSFDEFWNDYTNGYYDETNSKGVTRKICRPLQIVLDILEKYPEHKSDLLQIFDFKYMNLINPQLWARS